MQCAFHRLFFPKGKILPLLLHKPSNNVHGRHNQEQSSTFNLCSYLTGATLSPTLFSILLWFFIVAFREIKLLATSMPTRIFELQQTGDEAYTQTRYLNQEGPSTIDPSWMFEY